MLHATFPHSVLRMPRHTADNPQVRQLIKKSVSQRGHFISRAVISEEKPTSVPVRNRYPVRKRLLEQAPRRALGL